MINTEYLIPITIAIVEIIKRTEWIGDKLMPLVSVVVGFVLGYFYGLEILSSLVVGLAASGLYDLGKPAVNEIKKRI